MRRKNATTTDETLKQMKQQTDRVLRAFEEAEAYGTVQTECPHGCTVEPDGVCPHGYGSPLLGWGC